jgi:hypothetical protein
MHIYIYIVSFLYIMVGALIAFLYTLRGGKFYIAIPLGWGLCILGSFCASFLFPTLAVIVNRHYAQFFPETIIVPPIVIFGWFHITIAVIIASILRVIIKYNRPQLQLLGVNSIRKNQRLYLNIGLFYLLLAVVMSFLLIIGPGNKWRNGRTLLLYKTDHKTLLASCRELSNRISPRILKMMVYGASYPIQGVETFPQIIINLYPESVKIFPDGIIVIEMSTNATYGVVAFPENYESLVGNFKKYKDPSCTIELTEGLQYYDDDFEQHPEHKKEVEELLKKNQSNRL